MFEMYRIIFMFMFCVEVVFGVRYVSDNDLKTFGENLLINDKNNAAKLITLSLQGKSHYGSTKDEAPNDLLKVDKKTFEIPTISKLIPLYDNYDAEASHDEMVTAAELREEVEFLDIIMNTTVMSLTKSFLQSKDLVPKTDNGFKSSLKDIWFTLYSRGDKKKGSSAFEHIFLGELKKGQVSGLHNWIYFQYQEKLKHINYLGWVKKIEFAPNNGGILKLKYTWNNITKPAGTMFIGTSPEFEFSLYTVCFLTRTNDKCNLNIGGKSFFIQTYAFTYGTKSVISSAYPTI